MKLKKVWTHPLSGLTLAAAVTLLFNSHQVLAEESGAELNAFDSSALPVALEATVEREVVPANTDSATPAASEGAFATEDATVNSVDSNEIINVQPLWDAKYKGEGTVVAIIDSGLDIEHDVLKITDISKAKYKNSEEIEAIKQREGIGYGKWYNDKVVFGYNYSDADHELKEEKEDSHGMHVSGIAVANPSMENEVTKNRIYGVAPEAQLMFLRVFSDRMGPTTNSTLYSRAIRDAVKLGADSINLSLGGASGSLNDVGDDVTEAIEFARRAGVSVVIAAGNDAVFGRGRNLPKADAPDYGLVGDPAVARGSIAVASFNNSHVVGEVLSVIGLENNEEYDNGNVKFQLPSVVNVRFDSDKEYDYEFVGLGQEEDLADKDLSGKIALIKRGAITFSDKIRNVQAKGAIGAVVFDHTPNSPLLVMSIGEEAAEIPSLSISNEVGEHLSQNAGTYKLKFHDKPLLLKSPNANRLSDFTSWGLSADGELKPDVSAPGGDIYASINNGKYATMSGTSMASPHVAGAVALLKQAFKEKYPEVKGEQLEQLVKHLLMSTATPHIDEDTNAYTSPRRQGAGVINVDKAVNSTLYVTGMDDYGSVSLGNVTDTVTFNVKVHNFGNEARELEYVTHLNTDTVEEGHFTLQPRELTNVKGNKITVPANSSVVVPVTVSAAQYAEELTKLMPNGYFLEGFVRFVDPVDKVDVVSIPFVGFRGDFQAIPVIEKPIYDFADDEAPFYYDRNAAALDDVTYNPAASFYTALVSTVSETNPEDNSTTPPTLITLGSFEGEENDGRFYLVRYEDEESTLNGKPVFAISPNGDSNRDDIGFQGVFLRNADDVRIKVYAADDTAQQNPLWETPVMGAYKNYFGGNPDHERATLFAEQDQVFTGYSKSGEKLPDGEYKYVVTYYPHIPGSREQRMEFDLLIDTVKPTIKTAATYDEATRQFKPHTIEDDYSGIYRERVYYYETIENQNVRMYLVPNEDGSYTLPERNTADEELSHDKFWLEAEDFAGNVQTANVGTLIEVGNKSGIVNVRLVDHETLEDVGVNYRYIIRSAEGEVIEGDSRIGDKKGSTHKLPFGTYDITLLLFDETGVQLVDERVKRVSITEESSEQEVLFKVKSLTRSLTSVEFPEVAPEGTRVYLRDKEGTLVELPRAKYNGERFERRVLSGEYDLIVTLPEGYFLDKEDLVYTVDGSYRNVKKITINAKGNLAQGGSALVFEDGRPSLDLDADADGDGYTTLVELQKGSDPFDATSTPVFEAVGTSVTYDPTLPKYDETAEVSVSLVGTGVTYDPTLPVFDMTKDSDGDGYTDIEELKAGSDPQLATSTPEKFAVGTSVTYDPTLPKYDETAEVSVSLVGTGVTYDPTLPKYDETAEVSVSLVGTGVTYDPTLPKYDETAEVSVSLVGTGVTYDPTLPKYDETAEVSVSLVGTGVTHDPTLPKYDETAEESVSLVGAGVTYDPTLPAFDMSTLVSPKKEETKPAEDKKEPVADSGSRPSSTPKTNSTSQATLPETGEKSPLAVFSVAVMGILASVGLVKSKKDEETV